jgi:glycerol kinase
MSKKYYVGIDQGTTGVTAILFDTQWRQVARGYCEEKQIYPHAGWVEHDADNVWGAVQASLQDAMRQAEAIPSDIICIGLDHEGESIIIWDRKTGKPIYPAIVWQDRRTAIYCDTLREKYGNIIKAKTQLPVDAYFSATKIQWILNHVEHAREWMAQGRLYAGNMDSWLLWNMTGGKIHATDGSTASRTMLYNIHTGMWDPDILKIFDISEQIMPAIKNSCDDFGVTDPMAFLGITAPIGGVIVDQQAALLGQACTVSGRVKTTYGTGCFMLMNTGKHIVDSPNGILTTVAWQIAGERTYALDGGIYISGAATQWLRDGLQIIKSASETEAMAQRISNTHGLYFVPAFSGLAAPYWDSYARGMMIGITGNTSREDIVRATLESTAYQVKDVLDAMEKDSHTDITVMRCDGGASTNEFLMQFQADIMGIPVEVPAITDTTALGAAYIAAMGIGELSTLWDVSRTWKLSRRYEPKMSEDEQETLMYQWHRAIKRAQKWVIH